MNFENDLRIGGIEDALRNLRVFDKSSKNVSRRRAIISAASTAKNCSSTK